MAWHHLLGHMCCHHFLPPHTKRLTALHNSPTVSSVLPLQTPTPQTSFFFYTLVTLHLGQIKYCRVNLFKTPTVPCTSLCLCLSIYASPTLCYAPLLIPASSPYATCCFRWVCELMLWSFGCLCFERVLLCVLLEELSGVICFFQC
jgi:hypothetical protein